jgi:hypothetical protein
MSNKPSYEAFAGSWIVDAGPGQVKTVTTYTPIGDGKFTAVESIFNFDWTLNGAMPNAVQATTLTGVVEADDQQVSFVLIAYALDAQQKAVYILKAVGNKVLVDKDTISVENLIFHFYKDPETANPVVDSPDFSVPSTGTFPPVREYRIRMKS